MKKTVTATEARVRFGEVLRGVAEENATYIVERGGRPQAVIMPSEEYERLIATRERPDPLSVFQDAQREFASLNKSGVFDDLEETIREGRERRDEELADILR